jgi:hypothetical protein
MSFVPNYKYHWMWTAGHGFCSSQQSTELQISNIKFSVCLINHQSIEDIWKSGGIAPLILKLGTYMEVPSKLA